MNGQTGRSYGAWEIYVIGYYKQGAPMELRKFLLTFLQTGRTYGAKDNFCLRFLQTGRTYGAKEKK